MRDEQWRWVASLIISVLLLLSAIGYLDVVRGRQLMTIETNQAWVIRELVRLRDALDRHEEKSR